MISNLSSWAVHNSSHAFAWYHMIKKAGATYPFFAAQDVWQKKKIKENYAWNHSLYQLRKRRHTTGKKEELLVVRIWRVACRPLLQTKTLRAAFFQDTSSCSHFVCIKHWVGMVLKSSLMPFKCNKAKLLKMI